MRGELVTTASWRQLHAGSCAARRSRFWRREAVWGRSPRRTAAPNESEPLSRPDRSGERAYERDAQNPTEVDTVMGAGAAGYPVFLPGEICMGPRCGRPEGGNDDGTMPMQKSDLSIVAMKPVKVGGAKGGMD